MMNRPLLTSVVAVFTLIGGAANTPAAEESDGNPAQTEKNVPPGLQKKGGLPPGQAKKRAWTGATTNASVPSTVQAREPEKVTTVITIPETPRPPVVVQPQLPQAPRVPQVPTQVVRVQVPAAPQAPTEPPKYDKDVLERRARVDSHVAELDAMGQQAAVRDRIIARMYRRSEIPISAVEAQEKSHPAVGMGGIFIANQIARHAKVPVEQIYAEHAGGKSWGELANVHKVSAVDLLEKLSEAKASARDAEKDAARGTK
jgi:hypothetical protein